MTSAAQKVVVVTGSGGGIGRATCIAFAAAGWSVVGGDRDGDKAKETAELCGPDAVGLTTDVTSAADLRELVGTATRLHGRLDAAVNNAGVAPAKKAYTDVTDEEYDFVMGVNLRGVWLSMKEEIPAILATGGGAIVNISSRTGHMGSPGRAPYAASKHGVIGLTRSVALEYGPQGIRVNTICPGAIDTGIVDGAVPNTPDRDALLAATAALGRVGQPEEIASAALWLCSDGSSYVNGTELAIDGGVTRGYSGNRTS